ncbi:MAG: hypothetical protein GY940_26195 [bacterium]|nr:hypothetical protein [bacterium]
MNDDETTILEEDETPEEKKKDQSPVEKEDAVTAAQSEPGEDVKEKEPTARADTIIEDRSPFETGEFKPVQPGGKSANSKPTALIMVVVLLAVAILAMAYFLFIKGPGETETEATGQVRQMQELTQKVQGLEADVKEKQDEILETMEEVKKKTGGESIGVTTMNLSDEEQELLQKRIDDEKDVSVKSLLEDILDRNNEIRELKVKIAEIEELLPKPHLVGPGENHYRIAMDFLINEKNIDKKRAMELVERTALLDTMVPGFKVWNFYSGDEYGSSVTQGTADISPNTLIRRAKKKLVDSRDQAVSERDKLSMDVKTLEEKRDRIVKQVDMLANEKENLISKVGELNQQNQEMQETVNSLFYLLDTQRNLKKKKIIGGGFLKSTKLKDVSPEHFTMSIDLRDNSQIPISAPDLGVRKIRSVTLFPKFYKNGTDYNITIAPDKQTASVNLLDALKFKNERVVVSVK